MAPKPSLPISVAVHQVEPMFSPHWRTENMLRQVVEEGGTAAA
jgi:hypothetical protein